MLMIIGTRGWEHKQWNGSFYEDLLPEDWRLKFYSSNFGAALAPENFWIKRSKDEIEEFVEDIPEDYPLIFERSVSQDSSLNSSLNSSQNSSDNNLQDTPEKALQKAAAISTWVTFAADGWTKTQSSYTISQATIINAGKLKENSAVFKVTSKTIITDAEIKQVMLILKSGFKQFDVIYLFFDDALVEIDTVNTAVTLLKMLVLEY